MDNYKAAAEGDVNRVKQINSRRAMNKKCRVKTPDKECENFKGKTLLYIACERGQSSVVEYPFLNFFFLIIIFLFYFLFVKK